MQKTTPANSMKYKIFNVLPETFHQPEVASDELTGVSGINVFFFFVTDGRTNKLECL